MRLAVSGAALLIALLLAWTLFAGTLSHASEWQSDADFEKEFNRCIRAAKDTGTPYGAVVSGDKHMVACLQRDVHNADHEWFGLHLVSIEPVDPDRQLHARITDPRHRPACEFVGELPRQVNVTSWKTKCNWPHCVIPLSIVFDNDYGIALQYLEHLSKLNLIQSCY